MSRVAGRLAITGATGYIGAALARHALAAGWSVRALTRRPPADARLEHVAYALEAPAPEHALAGIDVVVHLAMDTSAGGVPRTEVELAAARSLLAAAQRSRTRVVFVSSQVARENAPTYYGRIKWIIEREVLEAGQTTVRPGLVYGGPERGLFGALCGLVRRLPALPALLPAPRVQPIHVDDLAAALLRIAELERPAACYALAMPEAVTFTQFLRAVARGRVRRLRWFVPVPIALVVGLLGLGRRLGSDLDPGRLRSLAENPPMHSTGDLQALGVRLRSLISGMHPAGDDRRRRLLAEARRILGYVLRTRPPSSLCRRYVRAMERLQGGAPLELAAWLEWWPGSLALLETPGRRRSGGLEARLEAATLLAEADPAGAVRFLLINRGTGPLRGCIRVVRALVTEAALRVPRLLLAPWLRGQRERVERGAGEY